jgi:importin subunit beta-1
MALADQERTENIIKLCVGLLGDLAETFPQGQIKAQLQKDWISEAIKVSRTRLGSEGKATAKWAKEVSLRSIGPVRDRLIPSADDQESQ